MELERGGGFNLCHRDLNGALTRGSQRVQGLCGPPKLWSILLHSSNFCYSGLGSVIMGWEEPMKRKKLSSKLKGAVIKSLLKNNLKMDSGFCHRNWNFGGLLYHPTHVM